MSRPLAPCLTLRGQIHRRCGRTWGRRNRWQAILITYCEPDIQGWLATCEQFCWNGWWRSIHINLHCCVFNVLKQQIQVCEVYKLQRETFYLGIDMYERFMATHTNIHKEHLQKIGVTCLFAAAKLEVLHNWNKILFNEHYFCRKYILQRCRSLPMSLMVLAMWMTCYH